MSTKPQGSVDDPAEHLGFIIERTAKRMKQYYQKMLRDANIDITVDQWILLKTIYHNDGASQFEIAASTFKDAPTVTRILDILANKQLIERVADPSDRRKYNIKITDNGNAQVQQILPVVKSFRAKSWHRLSKQQISEMTDLLNIVFGNLES